jgi:hypothetical protein
MKSTDKGKTRASGRMNAEWHKANVMPQNPSMEERIEWHIGHSEDCGCRPMPSSIAAEVKKRRIVTD